jgi:hypothetical protein
MADASAAYALGYSPAERDRLRRQPDELRDDSEVLLDRVGIAKGSTAIDLGCGHIKESWTCWQTGSARRAGSPAWRGCDGRSSPAVSSRAMIRCSSSANTTPRSSSRRNECSRIAAT